MTFPGPGIAVRLHGVCLGGPWCCDACFLVGLQWCSQRPKRARLWSCYAISWGARRGYGCNAFTSFATCKGRTTNTQAFWCSELLQTVHRGVSWGQPQVFVHPAITSPGSPAHAHGCPVAGPESQSRGGPATPAACPPPPLPGRAVPSPAAHGCGYPLPMRQNWPEAHACCEQGLGTLVRPQEQVASPGPCSIPRSGNPLQPDLHRHPKEHLRPCPAPRWHPLPGPLQPPLRCLRGGRAIGGCGHRHGTLRNKHRWGRWTHAAAVSRPARRTPGRKSERQCRMPANGKEREQCPSDTWCLHGITTCRAGTNRGTGACAIAHALQYGHAGTFAFHSIGGGCTQNKPVPGSSLRCNCKTILVLQCSPAVEPLRQGTRARPVLPNIRLLPVQRRTLPCRCKAPPTTHAPTTFCLHPSTIFRNLHISRSCT